MVIAHNADDTVGAILVGAFISAGLSGMLTLQVLIYFRLYPVDLVRNKIMVIFMWSLDLVHLGLACAAAWTYLIGNWGISTVFDYIPWTIAVTVTLTAIMTFSAHCFFAQRVYLLSGGNVIVTAPIVGLAFARLIAALVSTSGMIRLQSYEGFVDHYGWVFTFGLSLSASVDIIITASLLVILQRSRTGFSTSTDHIIDTIALYTIETGMVTCITTTVSLICWLSMPRNLIFLGLHFSISKLYGNSVLATLNARQSLRERTRRSTDQPPTLPTILATTNHASNGGVSMRRHASFMASRSDCGLDGDCTANRSISIQVEDIAMTELHANAV